MDVLATVFGGWAGNIQAQLNKRTDIMNYSINISLNGRFYFEINRLSDSATENINEFVGKLRDDYPLNGGYQITVSEVIRGSKPINI